EAAGLMAADAPGVVGAALHEDVSGTQQLFVPVHDGVDLALEHDDVVDGARLVHHRIARGLVGCVARADGLEARASVRRAAPRGIGRKLDDPQDAAALRRLEAYRPRRAVL